jgi:hypothetical protein
LKTLQQIGIDIGALVEVKNAAYGDSFRVAGDALRLLYPNGIAAEQLGDALLLARIWDKMKRIATDRDALGESPYQDIAGYGILGVDLHQQPKENLPTWQGSANGPNASNSSKAQPDSAASVTSETTTTNASEPTAPEPSLQLASSSPAPESAPVPSATGSASPDAADARRNSGEENNCFCGHPVWRSDSDLCSNCSGVLRDNCEVHVLLIREAGKLFRRLMDSREMKLYIGEESRFSKEVIEWLHLYAINAMEPARFASARPLMASVQNAMDGAKL